MPEKRESEQILVSNKDGRQRAKDSFQLMIEKGGMIRRNFPFFLFPFFFFLLVAQSELSLQEEKGSMGKGEVKSLCGGVGKKCRRFEWKVPRRQPAPSFTLAFND